MSKIIFVEEKDVLFNEKTAWLADLSCGFEMYDYTTIMLLSKLTKLYDYKIVFITRKKTLGEVLKCVPPFEIANEFIEAIHTDWSVNLDYVDIQRYEEAVMEYNETHGVRDFIVITNSTNKWSRLHSPNIMFTMPHNGIE